ncbi:MAG: 1-(5-phosphoribosyl)-5-[(5-phosphoribosylamino)methylideneamino]imidazole-4-carboxamide isomerase [Bacteroidota bacterium]|nr:1-(5-phosphoribosyl)-5-[(5-phosphoribosylamino)methylideneamino]imidazole-4-carboxamide isomerase [Bacteroidota bacterium]
MYIIPAIDIIDGKCVRLTQGDYSQKKIYNEDPLEVAKGFEAAGIKRLHLVDLDGAKKKKVVNIKVLESIAHGTSLHIDFGGGVQSDEDIQNVFDAGAQQITGGSIAVKNPELFISWVEKYGYEKIILGADVKNNRIAISGWEEEADKEVFEFLQVYLDRNIKYVICTDVSKDGLLQGPSFELYNQINEKFPDLQLIASGGVSNYQDLEILSGTKCYGVIVGKAIYEGRISLKELRNFV